MVLPISKTQIAKGIVTFIVGAGTTKIVKGIIETNVAEADKTLDRIEIASATYVIGAMAAAATKSYTDTKIDELIQAFQEFRTRNDIIKSEVVQDEPQTEEADQA